MVHRGKAVNNDVYQAVWDDMEVEFCVNWPILDHSYNYLEIWQCFVPQFSEEALDREEKFILH